MRIRLRSFVALLLAAGCASATKRYEQGQELEQQGRPAEAAQRYIDALKKDASLSDAKLRLSETGSKAVVEYTRQVDALESTAAHTDAAELLLKCDALIRDAAQVGVPLAIPAGYGAAHSDVLQRAVNQAIAQAASAAQRGDFANALQVAEHALQRWSPTSVQQASLTKSMFAARYSWAESEFQAGRFRSAYEQADLAAGIMGADRPSIDALKNDAVRRGTISVAIFPAVARPNVDSRILPELNDVIVLSHWQQPPQWINVVNSVETQRVIRLRNLGGKELDASEAERVTRQLGARYGVTLVLDTVRIGESRMKRSRHAVKTRAGADTAFFVEEGQLDAWAHVTWREGEPGSSREISHGDQGDRASGNFRRAVYDGNWRDLNLSQDDRRLFEPRDTKELPDALRDVARKLSDRIAQDIVADVVRRVQ